MRIDEGRNQRAADKIDLFRAGKVCADICKPDLHEAIALNTYARAELARLVAIRTRIKAAHTQPLSEEQLAMAAAQAAERQYMNFNQENLQ